MIDAANKTLFQVAPESAAPERDSPTPALKTWVTPKVITASMEDAGKLSAASADLSTVS